MKKRWIAGLLTLTMILGLTACGHKKSKLGRKPRHKRRQKLSQKR